MQKEDDNTEGVKTTMNYISFIAGAVMIVLVALTGCSSSEARQQSGYIRQPDVCIDKKWYGYHREEGCLAPRPLVPSDPMMDRPPN